MAKRETRRREADASGGRDTQKTFTMHGARVAFEDWAADANYDQRGLFLASFLAFTHLPARERGKYFRMIAEWDRGGSGSPAFEKMLGPTEPPIDRP